MEVAVEDPIPHILKVWLFVLLAFILVLGGGLLLLSSDVPFHGQPQPDAQEYATSANQLAHGDGYTTPVRDTPGSVHLVKAENPPRYPPGYPLVLSPFALVGHFPGNVELGAKLMALLMVLAVAWAAVELGGPLAAVLAVLLLGTGSFLSKSGRLVLSDAFAAGLAMAVLALLKRRTPTAIYLAGFLAGYGVLVRASGFVVLACLLIVLRGRDRLRALATALPSLLGLGAYQWATFGKPWRTGYGYWMPGQKLFSLSYVTQHPLEHDRNLFPDQLHNLAARVACHVISCHGANPGGALPNWLFYVMLLIGLIWVFVPPIVPLVGIVVGCRWWPQPVAQFILLVTVLTMAFYLPYFYQGARFMAVPVLMLTVLACAGVVQWAERRKWWREAVGLFFGAARSP